MLSLYKFLKFIFRHFIPAPLRYPMARGVGKVVFYCNGRRRRTILENLTPLIGPERARRLGPEMLANFAMTAVDFFCPSDEVVQRVQAVNGGVLEKTYRKSKRMIVLTAHQGNWELGISFLVARGFSVAGVYAPYREDRVVRWILAHRNTEVEWVPAARGAAEACISAIERGRVLGMVGDIPFGAKGRRVTIAGNDAHLPLGPFAIAVRAKAAIVPAFMIRQAPGRYQAVFHEPLWPTEGSFRKQMEMLQDGYRARLEESLKAHPEQWGVLQPFWDSTPTEA